MTERWSSVEDVSDHLGIADDTVYRWIAAGRLPAHRIGRHWKFKLTEVDDWVRLGKTVEGTALAADAPVLAPR